jgi:hypothetical protein
METKKLQEMAEDFAYRLHNDIPSESCMYDDENPMKFSEFKMLVGNIDSTFFNFLRSFVGNVDEDKLMALFYGGHEGIVSVGLYEASREYGGSEEGGWYYTCWHHVESKRMPYADAIKYMADVLHENQNVYEKDGKRKAEIELFKGQHTEDSHQHYC